MTTSFRCLSSELRPALYGFTLDVVLTQRLSGFAFEIVVTQFLSAAYSRTQCALYRLNSQVVRKLFRSSHLYPRQQNCSRKSQSRVGSSVAEHSGVLRGGASLVQFAQSL